jgi:hypothetical protein
MEMFLKRSIKIRMEVMRREFTKRQKSILNFIGMLSQKKPSAIVPFLKDFELCGVGKNKIKGELTQLEKHKVIFWNRETNEYRINEDVNSWTVPIFKGWDEERFMKLEKLNNGILGASD